jgi:ferredoxin
MTRTHRVRFEPVGVEIEVSEDETILHGGFRSGLMLMHGCKEGQCSACKSFLLDGDVDLERYSTFALADYEREEGYVLLCRAHAYSDLEVELINYDPELLTSGVPIQIARTEAPRSNPSPTTSGAWCWSCGIPPSSRSTPASTSTSGSPAPSGPAPSPCRAPPRRRAGSSS